MSKERYFWLIELLVCWVGNCNAPLLAFHTGLSKVQAKKYIKQYNLLFPNQLLYSSKRKAFIPSSIFRCNLISGSVDEYFDWVSTCELNDSEALMNTYTHNTQITKLPTPKRNVQPEVLRAINHAISSKSRIDIEYASFNSPVNEGRIIQPHSLVRTGTRHHVRAFDESSNSFKDFVLSRFRGVPDVLDRATHDDSIDEDWTTMVELVFEPDSRFSQHQRAIIETDYNMQNGQLLIQTRAALAQYLLDEMQVKTQFLAKCPEGQQLVLVNEDTLKPWLFAK